MNFELWEFVHIDTIRCYEQNNFMAGLKANKNAKRVKMKIIATGVRSTHTRVAQGEALGER